MIGNMLPVPAACIRWVPDHQILVTPRLKRKSMMERATLGSEPYLSRPSYATDGLMHALVVVRRAQANGSCAAFCCAVQLVGHLARASPAS